MKKLLYIFSALMLFVTSCNPYEPDRTDIGLAPDASDLDFIISQGKDVFHPVVTNTSKVKGIVSWAFSNGAKGRGDSFAPYFPIPGEYEITMTLYGQGGATSITKAFTQTETDFAFFETPTIINLTGGIDNLAGKTWVIDSLKQGHLGVGPAGTDGLEWWKAAPLDKTGWGLYDDKMNFKLDGFAYTYQNNGNSFVKEFRGSDPNYTIVRADGDLTVKFTPAAAIWGIDSRADGDYLVFSSTKPVFPGFDVGATGNAFKILSIDEHYIRLAATGGDGNAWHIALIQDGYAPDPEPEPEPEYKIEDIYDNFDGVGNITYYANEVGGWMVYDNPAPVPVNTSKKVARYTRNSGGDEALWQNLQIRFDYKLDIRERHVFKLKAFFPTYNDYTTVAAPDWWNVYRSLTPMVSVKLQNGKHGAPHETQAEVIQTVELGKWVELTFDFSAYAARTDFDRIVIQLGGEGHYNGGIFFIDDFELLK